MPLLFFLPLYSKVNQLRIFKDFDALEEIRNPVLTIGTFDGVHIGHQKIIEQLNSEAQKIGGESVLFTFYPHPKQVLFPDSDHLRLIQTQSEKLIKLRECGLQNVIVFPFTKEFSRLTAVEFVRDFLVNRLKVKKLVIGYDHQFGKNREGTLEFLKNIAEVYDFEVIEIPAQEVDEVNVSSTKIRNALLEGNVELANQFLGDEFTLNGKVVHGDQLGRKIGFPTANLELSSKDKLIPALGAYVVMVRIREEMLSGMMNIGIRPTVSHENTVRIELNIFDFNSDIYGEQLEVYLLKRIRGEKKFSSIEELKDQLQLDESIVRNYILSERF